MTASQPTTRDFPAAWVDAAARAEVAHDGDDWDDPGIWPPKTPETIEGFRNSYRASARAILAGLAEVGALADWPANGSPRLTVAERRRADAAMALRVYADREHPFGSADTGWTGPEPREPAAWCACGAEWLSADASEDGFEGCTERARLLRRAGELERGEDTTHG